MSEKSEREAYEAWKRSDACKGQPPINFDLSVPASLAAAVDELAWMAFQGGAALAAPEQGEVDTDKTGYVDAFYKIVDLLGIPALPMSPEKAFETRILPKLRKLVAAEAVEQGERELPELPEYSAQLEKALDDHDAWQAAAREIDLFAEAYARAAVAHALEGRGAEAAAVRAALELAEDVLSRRPYSAELWPDGTHPATGIEQIRAAVALARKAGAS